MTEVSDDELERVRAVVASHLPHRAAGSLLRLGDGEDHTAYEVAGELVVRFSNASTPAERALSVDREAGVLAAVAGLSPLAVPEPLFTALEEGCLAYPKLPGVPLLDVPGPRRAPAVRALAPPLGEFLAAIHGASLETMPALVETDEWALSDWQSEAAASYAEVAGYVGPARRRAIEAFLSSAPPPEARVRVLCHNDLGIEHVLVDPAALAPTAVIDWSDAAIVDPARDFGRLYRDLGPVALDALLRHYEPAEDDVSGLRDRAVFYGRCSVFEDLAYGLERGRTPYVEKSQSALEWLFPS